MAKSQRSKREKRLRTIRREISKPFYDKKEIAKITAQEAALAAPKLPPRLLPTTSTTNDNNASMDITTTAAPTSNSTMVSIDVDMVGGTSKSLKPVGKNLKKKLKIGKGKRHGNGKVRKKHNI